MPESDDEAKARRAQSILTQALSEAGIRGGDEVDPFPPLFGGTKVYWEQVGDDIELRLSSYRWGGDRIRTSIVLKGTASNVATLFHKDVDAVRAMVAVLTYLQHLFSITLPRISHDLMVRSWNMLSNTTKTPELLTEVQELFIKPADSAFNSEDKKLRDEIRGRRKRGGNTRTKPAWRIEATRKLYASRVDDRKLLATCIKDMFDKCDGEAGWVEELRRDKNFQLLASAVPDEIDRL